MPRGVGTTLGQVFVATPAVVPAVRSLATQFSATGARATARELATGISPFRISSGTFGALEGVGTARQLGFEVVSIKSQTSAGLTERFITGTGPFGSRIVSRELTKSVGTGEIGGGFTTITAPTTTLQGGRIIPGVRTIRTETILGGVGGRAGLSIGDAFSIQEGIGGIAGQVSSRQTANLLFRGTGQTGEVLGTITPLGGFGPRSLVGGVSVERAAGGTFFATGRAQQTSSTSLSVRSQDLGIRGIEFAASLPKTVPKVEPLFSGTPGRITGTSAVTSTAPTQIGSALGAAKLTTTETLIASDSVPSIIQFGGTAVSRFAGTVSF